MIRKILTTALVLVALGVVYACGSDRPLGPLSHSWNAARGTVNHDQSDTQLDTVFALRRSSYLPNNISQSAMIGPDGGEIDVDGTGARIVFPAGALARRTRISMTAKAGWNVAYEFGPHGITFDAPVTVQQDLNYTVANTAGAAIRVQAGYFQRSLDTAFLDPSQSIARVSELRPVWLDHTLNSLVASFYIYHFSGYILSSGFTGGGGDSTSTQ